MIGNEPIIVVKPTMFSRLLRNLHERVGDSLPVSEPPILVMRHAQSHANKDKAHFRNVADYAVTLTQEGEQQAKAAAEVINNFFINYKLKNLAITRSTYERTDQTCKAVLDTLSQSVRYTFYTDIRLREQDYNPLFDGLDDNERAHNFPKAYEKYTQRTFYVDETGGETGAALVARSISFLKQTFLPQIRNSDAGLLVTHSKTMRALAMAYLNHGVTGPRTPNWVNWFKDQKPNNCEIWVMQGKQAYVLFSGFLEDGSLAPMPDRFGNNALFSDLLPLNTLKDLPGNIPAKPTVSKAACSG